MQLKDGAATPWKTASMLTTTKAVEEPSPTSQKSPSPQSEMPQLVAEIKSEIDEWLCKGRRMTQEEIEQEAYDITSNDDIAIWYLMNAEEHGSSLLGIEPKHKTTETNKLKVMNTFNTLNPPQFSFLKHPTQGYPRCAASQLQQFRLRNHRQNPRQLQANCPTSGRQSHP